MGAPRCAARSKQSGEQCKNRPSPGKRVCRFHGGWSPGGPKGNKKAVRHGIYARGVRSDEIPLWHTMELGTVDDEIKLLKLQLRRCLIAQRAGEDAPTDAALLEITRIVDRTETRLSAGGAGQRAVPVESRTRETTRTRPDYRHLILRLTGLISRLEGLRQRLLQKPVGSTEPVTLDDARDHALALVDEVARRMAGGPEPDG